jgi:hypothetical protein
MKTFKQVVSVLLEFVATVFVQYIGWLIARWCSPVEAGENFWSFQGMLAGLEGAIALFLLVVTAAWIFRSSIQKALSAWGEWG